LLGRSFSTPEGARHRGASVAPPTAGALTSLADRWHQWPQIWRPANTPASSRTKWLGLMLRPLALLLVLVTAILGAPTPISAQGACEAIPAGPRQTDCFIGRARIANQKGNLAYDKARARADAAWLRAATGAPLVRGREVCRGKRAGTRACYSCCRANGLSASRCLRNCRQP
jgi:hypothetical protein